MGTQAATAPEVDIVVRYAWLSVPRAKRLSPPAKRATPTVSDPTGATGSVVHAPHADPAKRRWMTRWSVPTAKTSSVLPSAVQVPDGAPSTLRPRLVHGVTSRPLLASVLMSASPSVPRAKTSILPSGRRAADGDTDDSVRTVPRTVVVANTWLWLVCP